MDDWTMDGEGKRAKFTRHLCQPGHPKNTKLLTNLEAISLRGITSFPKKTIRYFSKHTVSDTTNF